jgi:hypothetical protein
MIELVDSVFELAVSSDALITKHNADLAHIGTDLISV